VPTINRLENVWEPIRSGSPVVEFEAESEAGSEVMILSSSYQGDDFQSVAVGQPVAGVLAARNEPAIDFDRRGCPGILMVEIRL
jgi:hypothetical protein